MILRPIIPGPDLRGLRFDRLTGCRLHHNIPDDGPPFPWGEGPAWEFVCACGGGIIAIVDDVIAGLVRDCGCRERERTSRTPEFKKLSERFWKYIDLQNRPFAEKCMGGGPCLLWTGRPDSGGRGQLLVNGEWKMAYHVAFYLNHCYWPEYIMHGCDNPACVNPDHLLETTKELGPESNGYDRKAKNQGGKLILG